MGLALGYGLGLRNQSVGGGGSAILPPTFLVSLAISDTSIQLDWVNSASTKDGTKIYISENGVDFTLLASVFGNINTYTATGLTYATTYYFKVAHYVVGELSNYSNSVTVKQWDKWYDQIFTDFKTINSHISETSLNGLYDTTLRTLFSETYTDSQATGYYYYTFSAKRTADFFFLLFHFGNCNSRSGWVKAGAILRHNVEGEVFNQTDNPAHTYNGLEYHIISSTDGFAGLSRMDLASSNFYKEIPSLHYIITTIGRYYMYANRFTSDVTNWEVPTRASLTGGLIYDNRLTGTLNISNVTLASKLQLGTSVNYNNITGLVTSSAYMGGGEYNFKGNCVDSASIDKFFSDLAAYYSSKIPSTDLIVDFSGDRNGYLTGGTSNANYQFISNKFTANGRVFTCFINEATGQQFDKGYAIFVWDDGFTNIDTALSILNQYNYKGAVGVIGDLVGTPGFCTKQKFSEINAAGHELCDHSNTHSYFTTLTEPQINAEISFMNNLFSEIGASPDSFIYPHGDYNDTVIGFIDDYRGTARTTDNGLVYKNANKYKLRSVNIDFQPVSRGASFENDKLVAAKLMAVSAKNKKAVVIFAGHAVDETGDYYSAIPSQLSDFVGYVNSIGLQVIQQRDLVSLIT